MKLDYAYTVFQNLETTISKLKEDGYLVEELEHDRNKPEDVYKKDMALALLAELEDIQSLLKWMNLPVAADGKLQKNGLDRYEISDTGIELTSGDRVDVYDSEREEWVHSAIEHNTSDYYIKALGRDIRIDGVHVRIKR